MNSSTKRSAARLTCWARKLFCSCLLLFCWEQTAAADDPVKLDAQVANKVTLQAHGTPLLTRAAPSAINAALQGKESSQCQPYGRASAATGSANAVVVKHDSLSATLTLTSDALAHGGHFRTCGTCAGNMCVGIFGNDTAASSTVLAQGVVTISFSSEFPHPGDYLINVTAQGQKPNLELTDGSGRTVNLNSENGGPGILRGQPGAVYYLTASLTADASNNGGCCEQRHMNSAVVDVRLTKAPILFSGYVTGYIRGGKQTSGFKNVGVLLLDGQVHCTGTVVGPKTVLTAAHCLHGFDKSKLTFILGSNYLYPDTDGGPFKVARTLYPDGTNGAFKFNPASYEDDVGVVYLETPLSIKPAVLFQGTPSWDDIVNQNQTLLFVGFGFNVIADDMVGIGVKREGKWRISTVNNRVFDFSVPGSSTCYGDSGGPAFVETATSLLLAGITSSGNSDCTQGRDARVDAYLDWLKDKIL